MPVLSKLNLNGITYDLKAEASGAVSGVKGEAEDDYRDGNVIITRANLGLGTAATNAVANNLTTTASGKVLDARQGKVLNDALANKVNTSDIVNNVTTTASGKVLDARQGTALNDKITPLQGYGALQVYTAGSVLDTYKDTGIWMVWTDNQVSTNYHFPPMAYEAGMLVVTSAYNNGYKYIQQEYIERKSGRKHVRTWDNNENTWTSWFINSYDNTRHAITTTDTTITINSNYSFWMVRNGFCFFQILWTCTDASQHSVNIGLPKSAFGNYLYYYPVGGYCRIELSGVARLKVDVAGNNVALIGSYPCSE